MAHSRLLGTTSATDYKWSIRAFQGRVTKGHYLLSETVGATFSSGPETAFLYRCHSNPVSAFQISTEEQIAMLEDDPNVDSYDLDMFVAFVQSPWFRGWFNEVTIGRWQHETAADLIDAFRADHEAMQRRSKIVALPSQTLKN